MLQRVLLVVGFAAVCVFSLLVVWYAQTWVEIGVRCAFETEIQQVYPEFIPAELTKDGIPHRGDRVVGIGLKPIPSWSDFMTTLDDIPDPSIFHRTVVSQEDLADLPKHSQIQVAELDGAAYVRVDYVRASDGPGIVRTCWCRVGNLPFAEILHSVVWLVLKMSLFAVVAVVFWKRPKDRATMLFFILLALTIGTFMAGYHWLQIATKRPLVVIFIICGALFPVVSLHFYLIFPRRKPFLEKYPRTTLALLYCVSGVILAALLSAYLTLVHAFRNLRDELLVDQAKDILMYLTLAQLVFAALMFLGCVASLIHSFLTSRPDSLERNQVSWILTGSLMATVCIGYSLYIAVTDTEQFGLGAVKWPMFAASLCITVAYGVSISRYGLMEVGQVLNWGIISLALSLAAGVVYSGLVFLSTLLIGSQLELSPFRQAAWASFTAWLLLLMLDLVRWQLRKIMERKLHREKYQLDKTLRRMSQAVEQLVDPPTLCRRFLQALAELLSFQQGAIFLREGEPTTYKLASHIGAEPPLAELPPGSPLLDALQRYPSVRYRAIPGHSPDASQRQLASLHGEIAFPLRHEGNLLAILLIGGRPGRHYDAEELHLLTTFAQIAALALHGARGHQTIDTLNRELHGKVEKISEQQRRIVALQSQLLRQAPRDKAVESATNGEAGDPQSTPPVGGIVGSSVAVTQLLQTVKKVAVSSSAVLIRGESGTGKELLARALHETSPRSAKAFVKVHCAALSPGLLESELFGHVKGAFTSAHKDKVGRFEMANGGTLFLDEIGDISPEVQTKLLRVLQEMTFERVGSSEPIKVDVRVIAATNQDLEKLMKEGKFREDLFYRLNVITIRTPALRERRDDIFELAQHFLRVYCQRSGKVLTHIDDEALEFLKAYDWPGNIRELENVIERGVVLSDGPTLTVIELPEELLNAVDNHPVPGIDTQPVKLSKNPGDMSVLEPEWASQLEHRERDRLVRALAAANGNKAKAARALGMPRSTFVSRLEKFGLVPGRLA